MFFIVALMQQLLSALRFIHGEKLVRRDLKPSNGTLPINLALKCLVLYSSIKGFWKIADFGLSAGVKTQSLRTSNNARATLFYMAPELLNEKSEFGMPSDIWSLGCILFEVCAGRKAFRNGYVPRGFVALEPEEFVFGYWIGDYARPTFKNWVIGMLCGRYSNRPSISTLGERFHELLSLVTNLPLPREKSILLKPQYHIGTDIFCRRDPNSLRIESVLPPLGCYDDYLALGESLNGSVKARKLLLGNSHPKTVWSILNLAWVYYYTGFETEADGCFKEALGVMRDSDFERFDMFSVMNGIASVLVEKKQYTEALEMWEALRKVQQERFGPEHPETLSSLHGLNWTRLQHLTSQGYDDPPPEIYAVINQLEWLRVMGQRHPNLGPNHPQVLTATLLLASAYSHTDPETAAELYSSALPTLNEIFGPEHLDTLLCRSELAWTYVLREQPHEAITIFEKILPLQQRKAGDEYVDETKKSLAEAKELLAEMNARKNVHVARFANHSKMRQLSRAPRRRRWVSRGYVSDFKVIGLQPSYPTTRAINF